MFCCGVGGVIFCAVGVMFCIVVMFCVVNGWVMFCIVVMFCCGVGVLTVNVPTLILEFSSIGFAQLDDEDE